MGLAKDGNSADSKLNNQELMRVAKLIKDNTLEREKFLYIADCKLVNEQNLKDLQDTRFITRLPASYNEHDLAIEQAYKEDHWDTIGVLAQNTSHRRPAAEYKYSEQTVELYDKSYRAVVVHSSVYDKRFVNFRGCAEDCI